MQRRRLGKSAIVVSDICMGTMTFGSQADEAEALRVLDASFDAGIDFYDTAEGYPVPPDPKWVGRTEEIVGKWLKTKPRDAIVLATKVSGPSHVWFRSPKREGMTALDRRNIMVAVEDSLRKLGTDYIDLYQTHWPDHDLPYDETMEVLDELVRAGKVRVLGCSNETSWGLMKSLQTSEKLGTARYHTIQNNFSLNNRRFEDELAQVCRMEGVSLIPYSPIGGGVLSCKYSNGARPEGARFSRYLEMGGRQAAMANRFANDRAIASAEKFAAIAQEAGMSPVTMAVAWSKQHDFVASTIVGVSGMGQLPEILAASDMVLPDDVMKAINKVSREIPYPMG
ncbi:aldo/keto reductase [Novosphingobium sp.]|jgi:aryl-alcohol dehydrogenase-like predicted oxidoreductase|uniref:aldo/keto reductase n=1 Tax=Novosphingobium sp. TaxID=1874826 RepID=UPI001EC2D14F|nr:aldo/keto reductase [Novosphingobium sp.]MBK6801405.1 aldo/keto reductase [Novosphingobium sp.]MBK9010085.1 aldo/keto reductase [Novosphingobium sp.]